MSAKFKKKNPVRAQFPHFLSVFQQIASFLTLLTFPVKFQHIWMCLNLIVPKLSVIKNVYRSLWCLHT